MSIGWPLRNIRYFVQGTNPLFEHLSWRGCGSLIPGLILLTQVTCIFLEPTSAARFSAGQNDMFTIFATLCGVKFPQPLSV